MFFCNSTKLKKKFLFNTLTIWILSVLFYTAPNISIGQNIEVIPAFGTIKEKSVKGFVVCLELDVKSVENRWYTYLKSLGRFDSPERLAMVGLGIMLPSVSNDAIDFYSKITVSPRCVQVFMGATRAGLAEELEETQAEHIKRLLSEFALEQYRQDIINQIREADRVVNLAVKAHDKRTSEGNSIHSKLKKNRQERERYFKNLEENANQNKKLKADSIQNSADMEAALDEINKVRAISEEKKTKLGQLK